MLETFGSRLRRRREEQSIALITVAEQTKIKRSLLEALESDDLSHWPTGMYRRAFVRSYAEAIHLDPQAIVREFLDTYPDPVGAIDSAIASDAQSAAGVLPPTRFHLLLSAFRWTRRPRRDAVVHEPPEEPAVSGADSFALAELCTSLGRASTPDEIQDCLRDAANLLDATGVILWVWDPKAGALKPAAAHGYSPKVLAQLPPVTRETNNATAAAFRSGQSQAIHGGEGNRGALVVPLMTASGCAGVLAVEVRHGSEDSRPVRVAATILAALLAQRSVNLI